MATAKEEARSWDSMTGSGYATIGGDGPSVTAEVTGATKITGTVHGIGGVEVGDEVSAQITGTASHLTATVIQDQAAGKAPARIVMTLAARSVTFPRICQII